MNDLSAQLHDSLNIIKENNRLRIENAHLRETIDLRDQEIARLISTTLPARYDSALIAGARVNCANVIDDYGNPCGDEGRLCDACEANVMAEHAWLRGTQSPDQERQDMIDAGREHLLPDVLADKIDMARMREKDSWTKT